MDSILLTIKKMLGVTEDDENFDVEIIADINSVFLNLQQLGVGPEEGFMIEDAETEWYDFIEDETKLQAVKTYIWLKVKMLFDTSLSSAVIEATKHSIAELEWRLTVAVE